MLIDRIWLALVPLPITVPITSINNTENKLIGIDRNDVYRIFLQVIEITMIIFMAIHLVMHTDRLLHVFCRLFLPNRVHPKWIDVLPSLTSELDYPFVAIQLPMMNEIECCETVINCACNLDWPKSRLFVQVLDDSTDNVVREVVNKCVQIWIDSGMQIAIYRRPDRNGFKAGNLLHGMSFISHAEYIAIFDVDFLPTKDYLLRTLPTLMKDPTVAFVQARWTFTNSKESLLTRMQEISLNYHHKCEQEVRSRASLFFSFNGTGGVWRISAIEQVGGWHTDTLVEDLDLSLRVYLNGWRSVYLCDVECLNELPPTVSAYLSQQHRWICGPMQVARKMFKVIYQTTSISWGKKLYCSWFLLRYFVHLFNIISLAVIVPMNIWIVQLNISSYICLCLLIVPTLPYAAFTFDAIHLIPLHTVFLNAMALHNTIASINGLFDYGLAKQWIVTPKFGCGNQDTIPTKTLIEKVESSSEPNENTLLTSNEKDVNRSCLYRLTLVPSLVKTGCRWIHQQICRIFPSVQFQKRNVFMAIYLTIISCLAFVKKLYITSIYLLFTSLIHFILAFGWMGRWHT